MTGVQTCALPNLVSNNGNVKLLEGVNKYEDFIRSNITTDVMENVLNVDDVTEYSYFDYANITFELEDKILKVSEFEVIEDNTEEFDENSEIFADQRTQIQQEAPIILRGVVNNSIITEETRQELNKNSLHLSNKILGSDFIDRGKKLMSICKGKLAI